MDWRGKIKAYLEENKVEILVNLRGWMLLIGLVVLYWAIFWGFAFWIPWGPLIILGWMLVLAVISAVLTKLN